MAKSSKKAVAAAVAAVPMGKKPEAEDEVEKAVSAKKQKASPPAKAVPSPKEDAKKAEKQQPPPKKVEDEFKVQTEKKFHGTKMFVQIPDYSSDETSESDEQPAKKPAPKHLAAIAKDVSKKGKQESTSDESSSDDALSDGDKPPVTGAQNKKEESESSDSGYDDESDEEAAPKPKAPAAATKKEDFSESEESESEDEDKSKTAKAVQPAKRAASEMKDESGDSSDSDDSDEGPEPPQKKQKVSKDVKVISGTSLTKDHFGLDEAESSAFEQILNCFVLPDIEKELTQSNPVETSDLLVSSCLKSVLLARALKAQALNQAESVARQTQEISAINVEAGKVQKLEDEVSSLKERLKLAKEKNTLLEAKHKELQEAISAKSREFKELEIDAGNLREMVKKRLAEVGEREFMPE